MITFLAIQNTYDLLEIALMQDQEMIAYQQIDKKHASKLFIPKLIEVLKDATVTIKDVEFIAVNQGPGPFTTLRTVIASVNGLSFATNIPLVGVDGLYAFLREYAQPNQLTVALLNAFTFDVYYGVQEDNEIIETGYAPIKNYLVSLKNKHPGKQFYFIGNGVSLYIKNIEEIIGDHAIIADPLPDYCSLDEVASFGLQEWKDEHNISKQLLPIYLKHHPAMQK